MQEYWPYRMDLKSSKEVAEYLKTNDMVILPLGCFEMHGPKIPLACDAFHGWATAILMAKRWNCLCLPPVYYTFPGASGVWPGTVDISPDITVAYIKEIVLALIKNGFKRVVIAGTHGPFQFMFQQIIRSIYQDTGHVVVAMTPQAMPEDLMMQEFGLKRGEDLLVLASMKILGLHGAFDPTVDVDYAQEFPQDTIGLLKQLGANVPWMFSRDYQHTGLRCGIKMEDADRAIRVMEKAVDRMADLPQLFKKYQKQMADFNAEKPWVNDDIWSV